MKVVVYNIQQHEKELLAKANEQVHDLTLISNKLEADTVHFANGKTVVVISQDDVLDDKLLQSLKDIGVDKVLTRTLNTNHIDLLTAQKLNIQVANTPYEDQTPKGIAQQIIRNLNLWGSGKCVGSACRCLNDCSKKN